MRIAVLSLGLVAGGWGWAAADERDEAAAQTVNDALEPKSTTEIYLGLLAPYFDVGGKLDGRRGYITAEGVSVVPELDGGFGGGLVFGVKSNRPSGRGIAIEGSVQAAALDGEMAGGVPFDATLALFSGDFKFFPTTGGAVEPWIQLGLCTASLEVNDGFLGFDGSAKDVTFSGIGFNVGLGALFYATDRLAFHVAAVHRFISYTELDYGPRYELDDELSGGTTSIEIGATVRFLRR